jgi:ribosome-associated translation inhibitor RaiA
MLTTVTARHADIPEELRSRAEAVLTRVAGLTRRPVEATAVFDQDTTPTVELRLHDSSGEVFVAHGAGADQRSALDEAEDRLRTQVARSADRRRSTRHTLPQPEA